MKNILLSVALCLQCMFSFAIRYNYGQHVVINKPVYENIYVAGGTIIVNAPVHGDLIIAGGTVIINDSVYNDILLGAGTVSFNGFVGGDIRCAGGRLDITKDVKGDIVAAGGNIHIGRDAVTGSLLASGGNVIVDGAVNGNLTGIFGDLEMNGRVAENAECRGRKITINGSIEGKSALSARTLVIGPGASFAGNVRYWTKSGQMDFGNTIENGKAVYDPTLQFSSGEWYFLGAATAAGLFLYLGMAALLILVIQYLFASTMKQAAEMALDHSARALLLGLLFIIGIPLAVVILFVTIIGIPLGLIVAGAYIVLLVLSSVISSVVIANWMNNFNGKNWSFWRISAVALLVYIVLKLFSLMPFVGWLVMLFIVCMALGSILLTIRARNKKHSAVTVQ